MGDEAHPGWAVYDLDRLRANLAEIRRRIGPHQGCIAALKGNAYGHGAVPAARALDGEGLAAFMTGSFDEACRLRSEGLRTPVVMFAGALPTGMADLVGAGLVPTVVDRASAEAAARAAPPGEAVPVYVKVDAGLGRLGVPLEAAEDFLGELAAVQSLQVQGLYTHLPFGDARGRDWAERKLAAFDALLARLDERGRTPPVTQARASSLRCGWIDRSGQRGLRRPPALRALAIRRCLACGRVGVPACPRRDREPADTGLGSPAGQRHRDRRQLRTTARPTHRRRAHRRRPGPGSTRSGQPAASAHTRPTGADPCRVARASGPGSHRCRGRCGRRCRPVARRRMRCGDRAERACRVVRDDGARHGDDALRSTDRALSRRSRRSGRRTPFQSEAR